jgi:antitoxin (DNA-binding transcriptional repressor) of toxin-antitoxin stability system
MPACFKRCCGKQRRNREREQDCLALVEKAAKGEAFIIAKAGKPMAKVIPYSASYPLLTRTGFLKGRVSVPDDFDRMGEMEIARMFGGIE